LKQIAETNVFEMKKLIKNNKGRNSKKNVEKTKYVQKVFFMGFERQQLVGKVKNNIMTVKEMG
jgi:hypothetical protein